MTVNFRIVEESGRDWNKCYEDFVRLYTDMSLTVKDIREKMNLGISQYQTLRKHCINEGLIPNGDRKKLYYTPKGYSRCHGKFVVRKRINGHDIQFATYSDEDDAKNAVKLLREINYDKEKFLEIMEAQNV